MPTLPRRAFIAASLAAGTLRALPPLLSRPAPRRVLTLVYDKASRSLRAVDRLVP